MNIRTLSLVFGAALTVAAGGLAGTACSSSNNNNGGGGTTDASTNHDTGSSSGGNNDSGGGGDDSSMPMGDDGGTGGVDCGKVATLHPTDGGAIFCGFDDAGADISCGTGMQCCLGGKISGNTYQPQECGTWGGACPNSGPGDAAADLAIPIECNQNADCTANGKSGNVCCLVGAGQNTPMGCSNPGTIKYSGGSIIQCEAPTSGACASGEVQICSSNSDCPSGMNCVPGHWKIFNLGFCQ